MSVKVTPFGLNRDFEWEKMAQWAVS